MPFSGPYGKIASTSGVAELDVSGWFGDRLQLALTDVTGTGYADIQVKLSGCSDYVGTGGRILGLASGPSVQVLDMAVDSVKVSAQTPGEEFTLVAGML